MKYVVQNGQTVKMEGYIETSMSAEHAKPESTGRIDKTLSTDFLMFEHTDGFNTITLEGEYFYSLWQNEKGFDVAVFGGGGAGIVVPRSAVKLTNKALHDEWHWAGVAGAGKFGLEVTGWQRYFIRSTVKVGYANMYDVLTTHDGGRADHGIGYVQYIGAMGVRF